MMEINNYNQYSHEEKNVSDARSAGSERCYGIDVYLCVNIWIILR